MLAGPTEGVSGEILVFFVVASTGSETCRLIDTRTNAQLVSSTDGFIAGAVGTLRLNSDMGATVDLDPSLSPLMADGVRPGQAVVSAFIGNGCWRDPTATLRVWLMGAPAEATIPVTPGRCDDPTEGVRLRVSVVEPGPPG